MNCHVARLLLPFTRPNAADLESAERQLVDAHLATCPSCAAVAVQERAWDERIGPVMRAVPVPAGLKDRLLARIGAECKAIYRLRRKAYRLAAAAALFAGFAFAWYWVHHAGELVDPTIVEISITDPDQVLEQLRYDMKFAKLEFPQELYNWDFKLLTDYYVRLSDGQKIPTLIFHKGDTEAKVTLWRRGKIDTSRISDNYSETIRFLGVDGDEEYIGKVEIRGGKCKYRDFVKPGGKNTL